MKSVSFDRGTGSWAAFARRGIVALPTGAGKTRLAIARSNARRVVGQAKLLGLMAAFEDAPDGAMAMRLRGH